MALLKEVDLVFSVLGKHLLPCNKLLISNYERKSTLSNVMYFSQEMIIWSDLVYRCNDHVPEVIYNELPPRLQAEVEIDTTRPPAPAVQSRKRRKKRNDESTGEEYDELFDDDEL